MSRVHTWQFLVNEVGEPIGDANITIYLAGTDVPAYIYTDEFSGDFSNSAPHLTTLSNGYMEFWIADGDDIYGYQNTQKFKIEWEKTGISKGSVDYVDIFPATRYVEPVDETDSFSIVKDKTISNKLAYDWQGHISHDALVEGLPIHGLELVDTSSTNVLSNKLITNVLGWNWESHRTSTVQTYNVSAGIPHGMDEVNPLSTTTIKNKLVSNQIIYDINQDIDAAITHADDGDGVLQDEIDTINATLSAIHSGIFIIADTDWTDNGGTYSVDIAHNFSVEYPTVITWNTDTKLVDNLADVESINVNVIRITATAELNLHIRITN